MTLATYISAQLNQGVRLLKAIIYGRNEVRDRIIEIAPFGVDSSMPKDIAVLTTETDNLGVRAILGCMNTLQKALPGELRIYAVDANGEEKCRIWLHADGTIELGGTGNANTNTKHAAQFEGLQTAFNEFKQDFNNFVNTFNAHTHTGVQTGGGVSGTTSTPGTATSADISGAKIDNLKTQ